MIPYPMVNQSRAGPSEQPTASLSLLVQVGGIPGAPGASKVRSGAQSAGSGSRPVIDCAAAAVSVGGAARKGGGAVISRLSNLGGNSTGRTVRLGRYGRPMAL